ncbi:MAG: ABC transporter permease [Chloroflexi bacterium]|nr:ABC transporter permease [Chloroflexota bacterium]
MTNLGKVFKFEFLNLITRRSFLLMIVLVPLVPIVLFTLLGLLNDDQTQTLGQMFTSEVANPLPIGVVDQSGIVTDFPDWLTNGNLVEVADEDTARQRTVANQLEGFFVISSDYVESGKVTYFKPEINMITEIVQQGTLDELLNYNLMDSDQDMFLRYTNPVNYTYEYLNPETADTRDQNLVANYVVPYVITMLFYMLILISSSIMINAVGKDKDNKTIEIMLTSVSPMDLFLGKLLGYGAASLLQMLAWGGGVVAFMKLGGQSLAFLQGTSLPNQVMILGIPYFLLGFFLYGSLMAGIGALAPNLREGNSSSFILTMPLIFVLLIINQLISEPNSFFITFLSIFPLTSSVVMMTRLAIGMVPFWQIALSFGVLFATVFLVVRGVSNLFSSQTLLSGDKFNMKTFFRTIVFGR